MVDVGYAEPNVISSDESTSTLEHLKVEKFVSKAISA